VDEDDAVSTVLNNKSAVHHVGFATPQQICAVSQDEHLAFYSLEEGASAAPSVSYDLRERFGCDYAINLVRQPISGTQGLVLALGANKRCVLRYFGLLGPRHRDSRFVHHITCFLHAPPSELTESARRLAVRTSLSTLCPPNLQHPHRPPSPRRSVFRAATARTW